jgi:hypothetical protein
MSVPLPSALAPAVERLLRVRGPQTFGSLERLLNAHALDLSTLRDAVAVLVARGRVDHRNGLLVAVVAEDVRDLPTLKVACGDDREAEIAERLSRIASRQRRRGGVG